MWLTKATNKNMNDFNIFLPSFDCFIWPIIELMKSSGDEMTKKQVIKSVQDSKFVNMPDKELSNREIRELEYRAERAFDLLLVAEIIEERFGNLYALTNGAFLITEEEARNLPRRVRTLDSYFIHDESQEDLVDNPQAIAAQTIEALKEDSLNEFELKEKLVKEFASKNDLKKNLSVVDNYVTKVDYVKKVLEAKDIVEEDNDGNIELCHSPRKAKKLLDLHYTYSSWQQMKSFFQGFKKSLVEKEVEKTNSNLKKGLLADLGLFVSVVGLSWMFVRSTRRKGK